VISALAHPPVARLLRTPRAWLPVLAWCALALAAAIAAHARGSSQGARDVLVGAYGALALPLLAYAIVGGALSGGSLRASIAPLVGYGARPERAAAVAIGAAALACAAVAAALAATLALVAHGPSDPAPARDALISAYAGARGGVVYAAWFALGASFGRRGAGRTALLVVDWVLGAGTGAAALITPRAHVRNLLGGAPPMELSEAASAWGLLAIAAACALVVLRRARS
jgi:hypothetical protein